MNGFNGFEAFIKWAGDNRLHWWPLQETTLLAYLDAVEAGRGSKFIGKNLVHALKFFRYIFGAAFEIDLVVGPMLAGRVSRVLATRKPTEQARPLLVAEVKLLENRLLTEKNVLDRYFIGCLLFALYSRARWGDLASMHSLEFDIIATNAGPFGFIEARTRIHKTSNTAERKAMYMPYVAPICGLLEEPWGLAWRDVLMDLGLLQHRDPFGPICRAPSSEGSFTKRALTSEEAGNMLNDYLNLPAKSELRTTSRSLKATTLVWAARYGVDDKVRSILGHHALRENSMACYSRDLLSKPLRDLCGLLLNIKEGKFHPDGTRSGWLSGPQTDLRFERPLVERPAEAKEEVVPKQTTIAGDIMELEELRCECNGQHAHLPWGRTPQGFATAAEVEYPLELCKQWAAIVVAVLNKTWKTAMAELPSHPDKRARAQAGKQTRKSLAFMPEWSHVDTIMLSAMPNFTIGTKLKEAFHQDDKVIPQYARILRISNKTANQDGGGDIGLHPQIEVAFGVPWSPEAFIAEALKRGHPANIFDGLAKGVKRAITKTANSKADSLALERARWFKKMIQWLAHKLDLVGSCYFDDYVCLAPSILAPSSEKAFATLLDLLGWRYDDSGDKADAMSSEVSALGVLFNLQPTGEARLEVANTQKRKEEANRLRERYLAACSHAVRPQSSDQEFGTLVRVVRTRLDFAGFLALLAEHQTVLSPPGRGHDCYRTWQALAVGTVPLVVADPCFDDRLYTPLGRTVDTIRTIPGPEELTLELLAPLLQQVKPEQCNLAQLDVRHWLDCWHCADEKDCGLMLLTGQRLDSRLRSVESIGQMVDSMMLVQILSGGRYTPNEQERPVIATLTEQRKELLAEVEDSQPCGRPLEGVGGQLLSM
eukprot:s2627_g4.t2